MDRHAGGEDTEYGRSWKALPEGQEGYREDVPMFTSKSMYDGSAGIGIFMIRLYEATSDERWLKEAEEAAAHIIATQVGPEWYQHTLLTFGGERNHSCAGMGGRSL